MRRTDRPTRAALAALVAMLLLLPGCDVESGWFACLFGNQDACQRLLDAEPPPPPPVEGAPAAPTGLTAAIAAGGDVALDWADNTEYDVSGYTIYSATFDHRGNFNFSSIGSSSTSDFVDGFPHVAATTYAYAVTARDTTALESARSAPALLVYCAPATTCHPVPGPPDAPTGLVAVGQDADGLALDWNDNTEADLDSYFVYRATASGAYAAPLFYVPGDESGTEIDADVYGLVPHTTYFFVVTAVDGDGDGLESARSTELTVRYCPSSIADCPQPPGPARGLRLASREAAGISIAWDATPGPNVARYAVYAARSVLSFRLIGTTTGTSFLDPHPDATFDNRYAVAALDADGRVGPRSVELTVRWCGAGNPTCVTGPAAPTGLTATAQPFQVALDWNDNTEPDLAGYRVSLAQDAAGPWSTTHSGLVTVSQRTVFDLPTSRTFFFRVTAVDTLGRESPPSAVVSATACPVVCGPSMALARLRPAAAGPRSIPFELTVSGRLDGSGTTTRDGESVVGTGLGFTGAFVLDPALRGLDPELKQLARGGLGGSWRARLDWRVLPGQTGTKSGVALATFANPRVGSACLRFEETSTVKRRGTERRVVTNGAFTFLGGTEAAAQLFGAGTYGVETRPDGSMLYDGKAIPATGGAPLPAECLALAGP